MRKNAAAVYLAYSLLDGLFARLAFTVYSVFVVLTLGLDPFRLVLMGTILEGTYLLFELPTGIVADTISRRLSIVIGLLGSGAAFVLLGVSTSFAMAALSQVLWGIFATFQSGADVAWLTDELGEESARPYYLRSEQFGHVGALVGIVISVVLGSIDYRLPIVLAGIGSVLLGAALAIVMPEERFTKRARAAGERLHEGFVRTFRDGVREVRGHRVLMLILATAALHGASTEGFDRLADYHFLIDIGLPVIGHLNRVVWFGILDGVALVLGLGALSFVKRRIHLEGHAHVARILRWIDLLLLASVVVFAASGWFWTAVLAVWVAGALRSVRDPIFAAWINQGLDPKTRATINSVGNQADAIGQCAGGPVLGLIGNASVPWALAISGFLRLPSLALYARAIRRAPTGDAGPTEEQLELGD
jgi:DHA3 family tetracycline resistance protein-like MFS transporter